jgi:hypothetical protein
VAAYNKAPIPELSIEDFRALDFEELQNISAASEQPVVNGVAPLNTTVLAKRVTSSFFKRTFGHLRALLKGKLAIWLAISMSIA